LLSARKKIEIIAGRKENYTFTRYEFDRIYYYY